MSHQKRLEKNITGKEKEIEKERMKIYALEGKMDSHKITRAEFNIKKKRIEERIRALDSRMRVLQGLLAREKRHQEELAEEKKKKKEEKLEKKKKKKKKEDEEE